MSTPDRQVPAWLLPTGLGVLVIILVAVALFRGPVELDPDSPEGTVQEYLLAVSEERWDDAVEIVHEQWRGACEGSDIAAFAPGQFNAELGSDLGFSGGRVTQETFVAIPSDDAKAPPPTPPESTTSVEVTIHRDSRGGLGSGWSEGVSFELVVDDDFWWLTGDPWPYFTWSCQGQ